MYLRLYSRGDDVINSALLQIAHESFMPVVRRLLGDDCILALVSAHVSLPGSDMQPVRIHQANIYIYIYCASLVLCLCCARLRVICVLVLVKAWHSQFV